MSNQKQAINTPATQKETQRQQNEENYDYENNLSVQSNNKKNEQQPNQNQNFKRLSTNADPFNKAIQNSLVDKNAQNPVINVLQGTINQKSLEKEDLIQPNLKGYCHFILTEFKNIIILHLLYTSMCYSTITTQNINLLIFDFDFDMMKGNIGDLAQCVTEYSFALVTNFSYEKKCDNVEFMVCDNDAFIGNKNADSSYKNCEFQQTNLSNINNDLVVFILPFVSFIVTQIFFIGNYIYLSYKYKKEGGAFGTGKYLQFTLQLENQHWYLLFLICQCIFFVFVCVTPLVVISQDIKFQYPNNFLVLLFQLTLAFILIKELFLKKKFMFPFKEEEKKFNKIIFQKQNFRQTNFSYALSFQEGIYNFQQESNNLTASFLLKRLLNQEDLKILVEIYTNMYVHIAKSKLNTSTIQSQQLQLSLLTQSKRIEHLRLQQEGKPTPNQKSQANITKKKIQNRIQEIDEDSTDRNPDKNQQQQLEIQYNPNNKPDESLMNTNDRQNLLDKTSNNINQNNISNNNNDTSSYKQQPINNTPYQQFQINNEKQNQQINVLQRKNSAEVNQVFVDKDIEKIKQQDKQSNYVQNSVKSAGIVNSAIMHSSCFNAVHIDEFDGRHIIHQIHISQQNFLQARKLKMKLKKQQQELNNKLQQNRQQNLNNSQQNTNSNIDSNINSNNISNQNINPNNNY